MKISILVASAVFFLVLSPADARNLSPVDGAALLKNCRAAQRMDEASPKLTSDEWSAGFYCLGYVQGVIDADNIWQTSEEKALGPQAKSLTKRCIAQNVSWPQIIRVLVNWLENNPAKLSDPGYDAIYNAMSQSFPCAVGK